MRPARPELSVAGRSATEGRRVDDVFAIVENQKKLVLSDGASDGLPGNLVATQTHTPAVALPVPGATTRAQTTGRRSSLMSGQELKTPLPNYDALTSDPNSNYTTYLNVPPKDGEFVLVKQITTSA
jgi:hypothetical protein